jgi:hypothetical protein
MKKASLLALAMTFALIALTGCGVISTSNPPTGSNTPDVSGDSDTTSPTSIIAQTDPAIPTDTDTSRDFGLISVNIPNEIALIDTDRVQYLGSNFDDPAAFSGWEGDMETYCYGTDDIEILVFQYSVTEDTAQKYIEPLITKDYDTAEGRLGVLETQTGGFFDNVFSQIYPFNLRDSSGGGRVLTRDGQPDTNDTYDGDEVQENYGTLTDGRQFVSRGGILGREAVLVVVLSSTDDAYVLGQGVLNTVKLLKSDVSLSFIRGMTD